MSKTAQVKQVNPVVLRWAREGIGFDISISAEKSKISIELLKGFEEGRVSPTLSQLKRLAETYKRPWVIFLMQEIPRYVKKKPTWRRALANITNFLSVKSLLAIKRAEDLQDILSFLKPNVRFNIVEEKITLHDNPENIAIILRKKLNISVTEQSNWRDELAFDKWRTIIEQRGIIVSQGPLDVRELRAFSIIDGDPYVIFINSKDTTNGKVFSLFHELGHILLQESSLCNSNNLSEHEKGKVEAFCNYFAGYFLVPTDDLVNHPLVKDNKSKTWDDDTLSALASFFKVSRETVLRRLLILNLTTQPFYEKKKEEWSKLPTKKRFGRSKDTYKRIAKTNINSNGYTFTGAVLENLNNGNITLTRASEYLHIKPRYVSYLEMTFTWNA